MTQNQITIEISFSLKDDPESYILNIAPEEYFDSNYLDRDEVFEPDSVARFWNGIDYLDENIRKSVATLQVNIYDKNNDFRIVITDTYWNKQSHLVRERVDYLREEEIYRVIIVSLKWTKNPKIIEILRMEKLNDHFRPIEYSVLHENDDGPETYLESFSRGLDDHGNFIQKFLS